MSATWSEVFRAYIDRRFGDSAQQKTAESLGVSPSAVSYWVRGSKPRERTRGEIERWSEGAVPAQVSAADDSANVAAVQSVAEPPANTGTDGQ